jgi:hypothetical protein
VFFFILGPQNFHAFEFRSIQRTTWCNAYTSICKLLFCEFLIEVSTLFYTKIHLWFTYGPVFSFQQIFSICAFATTTGFSSHVTITAHCHEEFKLEYSYPFR